MRDNDSDYGFLYLGATKEEAESINAFKIPFPDGSNPFESEIAFDGGRNANNVLIGTFVGRENDKQNTSWIMMDKEIWWKLNRFRKANNYIFWCRYFNHNLGYFFTRLMYTSNPRIDPVNLDRKSLIPRGKYANASMNFIDIGKGD